MVVGVGGCCGGPGGGVLHLGRPNFNLIIYPSVFHNDLENKTLSLWLLPTRHE